MDLVVGVDAGGTGSRAVVATVRGEIVGRGSAGPGNPLSAGPAAAAAAVAAAVGEALAGLCPASVVRGVLGIAGPATTAQFAPAWAEAGLSCPMRVVGDVVTAFASGSPAPAGRVLIAGTGAIAAAVRGTSVVRTADGLGWLLGDEGSGRWIGLRAVRAAVRDWSSPFAAAVATRAGAPSVDAMVAWAHGLPLTQIGGLAPLVCRLAAQADPHARAIVAEAVGCLIRTLDELDASGPVVLGGGLLTAGTPVRAGVSAVLRSRGVVALTARDPALGAARLAGQEATS
nr:BadF/BadG/BcrA/BcrD ATPase family protein [uncultured Actinoplanes sp.]